MILERFRTLVHALLLAAQVSARHASSLSVRDDVGHEVGVDQPHERWQHYADNGIRFWFEWRHRAVNVPDAPLLSGIDDLLHPRYGEPSLNERTEVVIAEELKVRLDCADWQSVHMNWEPPKTEQERQLPREQQPKDSEFVCSVDAEDGLFVIELSYRGRLPLRFSQLAWWVWQRETARKGLPVSGLRTILVEDTVSDDTNFLLDWALRNERLDAEQRAPRRRLPRLLLHARQPEHQNQPVLGAAWEPERHRHHTHAD